MTINQVRNFIKLLIDDNSQVFHKNYLIDKYVDEAQLEMVKSAYQTGDERMLRPLYRIVDNLTNGAVIEPQDLVGPPIVTPEILLYPKVCLIYLEPITPPIDRRVRKVAKFLERGMYEALDYRVTDFNDIYGRFYYTVDTFFDPANTNLQDQRHTLQLNFDTAITDIRARLTYIKLPRKFNTVNDDPLLANYGLEIPAEFHPLVCFKAADKINALDALETDRSSKVRLQQSGGVDLGVLG